MFLLFFVWHGGSAFPSGCGAVFCCEGTI
jgi:hypothetical protein